MVLLYGSNLHNLLKWLKSVKAMKVRDLPIYANYASFYAGSEITTGMMNDRIQLSINLDVGMLHLYNADTLQSTSIDITSNQISNLNKILEENQLPVPDFTPNPVPWGEINRFREFADFPKKVLEVVKFKLPAKHSQVYLWGHNFDFDLVVYFDENKQIDVGVSPGDANHPEPYLYITPRPFNKNLATAELANAEWIFEPWQGIIAEWSKFTSLTLSEAVDEVYKLYSIAEKMI